MRKKLMLTTLLLAGCSSTEPVHVLNTSDPVETREFIRDCKELSTSPIVQSYHSITIHRSYWTVRCYVIADEEGQVK